MKKVIIPIIIKVIGTGLIIGCVIQWDKWINPDLSARWVWAAFIIYWIGYSVGAIITASKYEKHLAEVDVMLTKMGETVDSLLGDVQKLKNEK